MEEIKNIIVVDLLFGVLPIGFGVLCLTFFSCVLSSFAIILKSKRERELIALLLLSYCN